MDSAIQIPLQSSTTVPGGQDGSKLSSTSSRPSDTRIHLRSCTFCRARKIKCDRQAPCKGCTRVGAQCIYPPGPGRAPKQPRRGIDPRVLDRLSRLETLMRRMSSEVADSQPQDASSPLQKAGMQPTSETGDNTAPVEQRFGRLVIDDTRSCYVSNILWASLGDEIEELRDLLHEPTSDMEEEECDVPVDNSVLESSTSSGCNAAIMGFQTLAQSLLSYHPSVSQSVALLEIFKDNVALLVRIFHMPTLINTFWDAIASLDTVDRDTEALLFSIYYSAVISMEPQQCESLLGISQAAALKHYQFATQQAIARADVLNTQSMVLLQAVVLFLTALRNKDASRTVWSLTALVFHIARAMGLHRDGSSFGLRPLETELRRRLWWYICLLDIRSAEYHGCEPIVHDSMFDTQLPLNVNDSDLRAEMTEPPAEREGATEMTFCLVRCEITRLVWKIGYMSPNMQSPNRVEELSLESRAALAQDLQDRLEEHYLKYCNVNIPFFRLCVTVAWIIIFRTWLVVYYPPSQKDKTADLPSNIRDQLFLTSIKTLKLSNDLIINTDISRWLWHSKAHMQWHAIAFALSEICVRPPSEDCDRAWAYVRAIYDLWKMKDHKGNFWRPINRLMAKAQYVRELQQAKNPRSAHHSQVASTATEQPSYSTLDLPNSFLSTSETPGSPSSTTSSRLNQHALFTDAGDSTLGISLQEDFFDATMCFPVFPDDPMSG
ncbi:uncharacterized protein N7459_003466 [Penicillium hispanicum]|uniref:uncharacterized protein n=1 Tax=Penicillium hispanicum TaxID=1080232 RepID=UPI00253FBB25|nr:uncharacterized protein N7459_003466 [Penicillium hispanicum]KAJ5587701.1 hypothetical protein N7459_003466 [Penicillium hispanicum]